MPFVRQRHIFITYSRSRKNPSSFLSMHAFSICRQSYEVCQCCWKIQGQPRGGCGGYFISPPPDSLYKEYTLMMCKHIHSHPQSFTQTNVRAYASLHSSYISTRIHSVTNNLFQPEIQISSAQVQYRETLGNFQNYTDYYLAEIDKIIL